MKTIIFLSLLVSGGTFAQGYPMSAADAGIHVGECGWFGQRMFVIQKISKKKYLINQNLGEYVSQVAILKSKSEFMNQGRIPVRVLLTGKMEKIMMNDGFMHEVDVWKECIADEPPVGK